PPTTEIYTLSLHDALPISGPRAERREDSQGPGGAHHPLEQPRPRHYGRIARERQALENAPASRPGATLDHPCAQMEQERGDVDLDRKSTRLNSSHVSISYA